jgi:hypothetical protein
MPIIDLKNVDVYLEDGTSKTGAVNLVAGYTAGATQITVDGFVGIIPIGARLILGAHATEYRVTATTETGGNTTSVTFTPGLSATLADNAAVVAGPVYLKIKIGDGNITWSEKRPREYKKDRGRLDQVRDGDEEPMDVSINFQYEELTASDPTVDPPTPEDVLKRRGAAATWLSSDTDICSPFAVNIVLIHRTPICSTFKPEKVTLPKFRHESLDHDPKAGTMTAAGKCNATEAIVQRLAA